MDDVRIGLVGLGTVGSGVARLLLEQGERISRYAGRRLRLAQVVVQQADRPRDVTLPAGLLSTDLRRITDDPSITVAAHLVGGIEPARQILLDLLAAGKDVVTANKALLAEHGPELFDAARRAGRAIAFEGAVAGGIPIVANVSQCLSANQILSIHGILNGTCNFLLTQMEKRGADYATALAEAQRRGYAELDPTLDVDGTDTVQKLAILALLAFGVRPEWRDIPRLGIDQIDPSDLRYAGELGYRVKLLAVAELGPAGLEMHVWPTLVRHGTPLAEVRGAFNAVNLVGDAVGPLFFHGQGAGQMPTASAVVADLIDMVVGRSQITFGTLKVWAEKAGVENEPVKGVQSPFAPRTPQKGTVPGEVKLADPADAAGRYYLRFNAADQPGVLAEIAGELGRQGISIASVIQHIQDEAEGTVPLVIMTHDAKAGALDRALAAIEALGCVRPPSTRMRVYDVEAG